MGNIYYSQTYTGNPVYVAEFTPATRADWVNNVIEALLAAGWSHISGSGTDRVLGSGTTPDNLRYKVRVWDPGSGNCARLGLRNWAETILNDSVAAFCIPGGMTWKIVASPFQFIAWVPGSTSGRTFVMATAPKLEPAMSYTINTACYMGSNDDGDGNATSRATIRTGLHHWGRAGIILNLDSVFNQLVPPDFNLLVRTQNSHPAGTGYTRLEWLDGSKDVMEARISFHPVALGKWIGYLWDAMVVYETMNPDQTVTWDGKTWVSITANNTQIGGLGTVCVLVS